ncbi:hypothetical protein CMUS01_13709 [Colletotrichum musicola]|uniref:Uncharacterized protein n=1 Tax=Colletotrichum musicola TaxID=2175873 RepID=A0A8H6JA23_9PEZI|nr:hypothetical protein CMUS01_13709 [Colletotrichum musicola]
MLWHLGDLWSDVHAVLSGLLVLSWAVAVAVEQATAGLMVIILVLGAISLLFAFGIRLGRGRTEIYPNNLEGRFTSGQAFAMIPKHDVESGTLPSGPLAETVLNTIDLLDGQPVVDELNRLHPVDQPRGFFIYDVTPDSLQSVASNMHPC